MSFGRDPAPAAAAIALAGGARAAHPQRDPWRRRIRAAATVTVTLAVLDLGWLDFGLAPRVLGRGGDAQVPVTEPAHAPTTRPPAPAPEPEPAQAPAVARRAAPVAAPATTAAGRDAARADATSAAAPTAPAPPPRDPAGLARGCDSGGDWQLLRHIYFRPGSAAVSTRAARRIDAVARRAAAHHLALFIDGHTDRRGGARLNDALSAERARAVAARARAAGVPASELLVRHFGARRPIAPNTAASRWRNRRVSLCLSHEAVSP